MALRAAGNGVGGLDAEGVRSRMCLTAAPWSGLLNRATGSLGAGGHRTLTHQPESEVGMKPECKKDGHCAARGQPSNGYVWTGCTRREYAVVSARQCRRLRLAADDFDMESCSEVCDAILWRHEHCVFRRRALKLAAATRQVTLKFGARASWLDRLFS